MKNMVSESSKNNTAIIDKTWQFCIYTILLIRGPGPHGECSLDENNTRYRFQARATHCRKFYMNVRIVKAGPLIDANTVCLVNSFNQARFTKANKNQKLSLSGGGEFRGKTKVFCLFVQTWCWNKCKNQLWKISTNGVQQTYKKQHISLQKNTQNKRTIRSYPWASLSMGSCLQNPIIY